MAKRKSRTIAKESAAAQDDGQAVVSAATDVPAEATALPLAAVTAQETAPPVTDLPPLPPILAEKATADASPPATEESLFVPPSHAHVQAPPRGKAGAITIDNRLGYRKETVDRGSKRQIRFANREGGQRPDDELLAPVREGKPTIEYRATEKAWQARNDAEGRYALDLADQRLRDLSHKRRQGPER